jgi:hypothetical protein
MIMFILLFFRSTTAVVIGQDLGATDGTPALL